MYREVSQDFTNIQTIIQLLISDWSPGSHLFGISTHSQMNATPFRDESVDRHVHEAAYDCAIACQ